MAQPDFDILTLSEVKTHLRIGACDTSEDLLIQGLMVTAQEQAESILWRSLSLRDYDAYMQAWPDRCFIRLPYPPLNTVTLVEYTDNNGVTRVFDGYTLDTVSVPGRLVLKHGQSWPCFTPATANPIHIKFNAGYGKETPATIKAAMLLLIGNLYENRGDTGHETNSRAIDNLLMPYRVFEASDAVLKA